MAIKTAVCRADQIGKTDIDIEALIYWAYARQRVDLVRHETGPTVGNMWNGVEQISQLGCSIDRSGPVAHACQDDAVTVDIAVAGCKVVLAYSARGLRPDWYPDGVGRFVPVRGGGGRSKKIRDRRGKPIGTKVRFEGNLPDVVANGRRVYSEWWSELNRLATELWGKLSDHNVTGPAVHRRPWERKGPEGVSQ